MLLHRNKTTIFEKPTEVVATTGIKVAKDRKPAPTKLAVNTPKPSD